MIIRGWSQIGIQQSTTNKLLQICLTFKIKHNVLGRKNTYSIGDSKVTMQNIFS